LTTFSGSEFQTVGAATEKARLAKTVRVRGTASLGAWLDHALRLDHVPVTLLTVRRTEWPKKSKPLPNNIKKIVLNRIKACQ